MNSIIEVGDLYLSCARHSIREYKEKRTKDTLAKAACELRKSIEYYVRYLLVSNKERYDRRNLKSNTNRLINIYKLHKLDASPLVAHLTNLKNEYEIYKDWNDKDIENKRIKVSDVNKIIKLVEKDLRPAIQETLNF